jgi:hypothetical protein
MQYDSLISYVVFACFIRFTISHYLFSGLRDFLCDGSGDCGESSRSVSVSDGPTFVLYLSNDSNLANSFTLFFRK